MIEMDIFELNGKIELIYEDDETTEGIIHDFLDDKLYVAFIADDKKFKLLYIDEVVTGVVFKGIYGYSFEATITNRIIGDYPIYELSNLCNFIRVQRRDDVRVDCVDTLEYSISPSLLNLSIPELEKKIVGNNKYFKPGIVLDLSGGGIKFSCEKSLNKDQLILFKLMIDKENMLLKGKALHKSINMSSNDTMYTYGVQFKDITELQRERIIKYLFVLMRKNKQNKR